MNKQKIKDIKNILESIEGWETHEITVLIAMILGLSPNISASLSVLQSVTNFNIRIEGNRLQKKGISKAKTMAELSSCFYQYLRDSGSESELNDIMVAIIEDMENDL